MLVSLGTSALDERTRSGGLAEERISKGAAEKDSLNSPNWVVSNPLFRFITLSQNEGRTRRREKKTEMFAITGFFPIAIPIIEPFLQLIMYNFKGLISSGQLFYTIPSRLSYRTPSHDILVVISTGGYLHITLNDHIHGIFHTQNYCSRE